VIRKEAPNTGHQDCWTEEYRKKKSEFMLNNPINRPGTSCFTTKIKCERCGCNFRRNTAKTQTGMHGYWRCTNAGTECRVKKLLSCGSLFHCKDAFQSEFEAGRQHV